MAQITPLATTAAGGAAGAGGTLALRETMDMKDGSPNNFLGDPDTILGRVTRPSVLYGVGGGLLSTGLWYASSNYMIDMPDMGEDFITGFAGGGLAAGAASAIFPVEAANGGTKTQTKPQTVKAPPEKLQDENGRSGSGGSTSQYAEAE